MNLTKEQWQKIGGAILTALLAIAAIGGWWFPVEPPTPSSTTDIADVVATIEAIPTTAPSYVVQVGDPDPGAVSFSASKGRYPHIVVKKLTVQAGGANFQSDVDMDAALNVDGATTLDDVTIGGTCTGCGGGGLSSNLFISRTGAVSLTTVTSATHGFTSVITSVLCTTSGTVSANDPVGCVGLIAGTTVGIAAYDALTTTFVQTDTTIYYQIYGE